MANFTLKSLLKDNSIYYRLIDEFTLEEKNVYSNTTRIYNLVDDIEKIVFQTHLKHYSRYVMKVHISSSVLYHLHKIKWL